jgi:sec-independent protein translocase protein TatA
MKRLWKSCEVLHATFAIVPHGLHEDGAWWKPHQQAKRTSRSTAMPNIGPMELVIVLVVALIILGPKRLPGAGRSLGRGMREFKDSLTGQEKAVDQPLED